ncbi:MAG: iron-containing redox enzyme family protein [Candidatus Methylacidiphilales bacterium]|nr:iron-containing redox enzyme family protein [Candidatus Methylacidiphilales bacterium]
MRLETFRLSQAQFYFAVRFFSRPMAMLTARMPTSEGRRSLLHNLAEEHGFDDESSVPRFDPALAHDLTFLTFMHRIGMDRTAMRQVREGAGVRAFNLALMGACQMESTDLAFAMLGIIEYAFADISALIGKTVVDRNWLSEKQLIHYNMHAEIDKRHAAGFFDVLAPAWEKGDRAPVEDGIALGLHVFDHLYRDLATQHDHNDHPLLEATATA